MYSCSSAGLAAFPQVQQATERFVAQIQSRRPTTLQTPSLDFSKPRLVQISVTDVGACMPMAAVVYTLEKMRQLSVLILYFMLAASHTPKLPEIISCSGAYYKRNAAGC